MILQNETVKLRLDYLRDECTAQGRDVHKSAIKSRSDNILFRMQILYLELYVALGRQHCATNCDYKGGNLKRCPSESCKLQVVTIQDFLLSILEWAKIGLQASSLYCQRVLVSSVGTLQMLLISKSCDARCLEFSACELGKRI
eukprot:scaffold684_cov345-Pavlova_lutheri.AAC.87